MNTSRRETTRTGPAASVRDGGAASGMGAVAMPSAQDFMALRGAYRATGGVARGEDLACLMEEQRCGNYVSLARLIADDSVFAFEWRHALWVPMFQFDLHDMAVRPDAQQVRAALGAAYDGWALATWFIRPNAWLTDRMPVELMGSELEAVLQAARADRFIAAG